jgi:protein-S-isoprenylcysteine O-methyltransferase Ste14
MTKTSINYQQPPKLFAWIASVTMISLIILTQFIEQGKNAYLRYTGVFVLLLAGVFIFAPFFLLSRYGNVKDGQSYTEANKLVDKDLYAITRHPQYLGYMLFGCGFTLLAQNWIVLLLTAVCITCFYLQAIREEKYCLVRFGEPYKIYLQQVPRFNVLLGAIRLIQGNRR